MIVVKTRFTPPARPTPHQVVAQIIPVEARRAGVSPQALVNRIRCESGFRWWASNGQYSGLGQYAPSTFYRGMSTIGSRAVVFRTERWRSKRVMRLIYRYNLPPERERAWLVRQKVVHIYRGVIPVSPPVTHGWAQVRIMAQAIAGRSAVHSSEWACST